MKEECPLKKTAREFKEYITKFPGHTEEERMIQKLQYKILAAQAKAEAYRRINTVEHIMTDGESVQQGDTWVKETTNKSEPLYKYIINGINRWEQERIRQYTEEINELRSSIQTAA